MSIFGKLFKKKDEPLKTKESITHEETIAQKESPIIEPKDYVDHSDAKIKGFDMALAAIKERSYGEAEEILKANDYKPAIAHSDFAAYDMFFEHKIAWLEYEQLPIKEVKEYLLLYYLYNNLTRKTILADLAERTGIIMKESELHHIMRIIKALDEVIAGQEMSATLKKGTSGMMTYYVVKTMKDGRVCEHCKEMEGQKFMYELAVIGENYPPFDCCKNDFCRCYASAKME